MTTILKKEIPFERSFASYRGVTESGKFKIDCWDTEKNGCNPKEVFKSSHKKYWFTCDQCDHSFESMLSGITGNSGWCPYCSNKQLCQSSNCEICFFKSFLSFDGKNLNNKLKIKLWDYDKNKIAPREVFKSSSRRCWFKCDKCSHSFESSLSYIIRDDRNWCPYCSNQKLCNSDDCKKCFYKSFLSFRDKTLNNVLKVDCWDYEKNKLKPRNVFKGTNKKFWFKCDVCFHLFESPLTTITGNIKSWCPYCSNPPQKLCNLIDCRRCFNKSLSSFEAKTSRGKKIECWDYSRNKLTPREVFKSSGKKFWFKCDVCFHSFKSLISFVTGINQGWCPYCASSSKKLCQEDSCNRCFNKSFSSFRSKTPCGEKINCWDYEKNELKPRDVFKSSTKKFYFKCDVCFHSFKSSPNSITSTSQSWCPYCSSTKLCQSDSCERCFNKSFLSYKELTAKGKLKVECWDYHKNMLNPRNLFKGTLKKFYFKCDQCFNSFQSSINNITGKNQWCPYCKNKTEGKFKTWFHKKYPNHKIKSQPKYDWCKNDETKQKLPFDFVVESLKIIIEIDGEQHFTQVSSWKTPEHNLERDKYKMKKGLENGYSVIRILQEDIWFDKNNWEEEFNKVFQEYSEPILVCVGCQIKYQKHLEILN